MARDAAAFALSVGGTLGLTAILGPAGYGTYGAALGMAMSATALGDWGFTRAIMRSTRDITPEVQASAWTANLCIGGALAIALAALAPTLERTAALPGLAWLIWLLTPGVVLSLAANYFTASLNRELRFKRQSTIGLAVQAVYFAAAIALAAAGAGAAAPALAWTMHQAMAVVWLEHVGNGRPPWRFRFSEARLVASDGLGMRAPLWIGAGVFFVRQLLLGRILGASALGHLMLAERLVETANLGAKASGVMTFPMFSRIGEDAAKKRRALRQALVLQGLVCGGLLIGLATLAPAVLPTVLGEQWQTTGTVLALCALWGLLNSQVRLLTGFLNVERAHGTLFLRATILGGAYLVLVGILSTHYGVGGAAAAGLTSAGGLLWLSAEAGKRLESSPWSLVAPGLLFCMIPPLFIYQLGWIALLPLLALPALADVRKVVQEVLRTLTAKWYTRRGAAAADVRTQ